VFTEAGDVFRGNRGKLASLMEQENIDTLILLGEPNIIYTTGIREPTGALILSKNCTPTYIVSILDYTRISGQLPSDFQVRVAYRASDETVRIDIPKRLVSGKSLLDTVISEASKCGGRIGVDLDWTSHSMASRLIGKLEAVNVSDLIRRARSVKSNGEIELIRKAAGIADEALRRLLDDIHAGASEAELAGLLRLYMLRLGSWGEAFPSIVAFYSNTAYPHHTPTSIQLGSPGPILIDWGAIYSGYRSDSTRMLHYGKPNSSFKRHYEVLLQAQLEAIDTVAAGVEASDPDTQARRILAREGLDGKFIHGLGHGVGVEIHEDPYLRPGSKTVLEPGMIVTVEPGIYLEGAYGIRVEDTILVTKSGSVQLTRFTKTLLEFQ